MFGLRAVRKFAANAPARKQDNLFPGQAVWLDPLKAGLPERELKGNFPKKVRGGFPNMTLRPDCESHSQLTTALRSSTRHQSPPVPPEQLRQCLRAVFSPTPSGP